MDDNNSKPEGLTRAEIHQIACRIRDQTATPEDAQQLLTQFCDFWDRGATIPLELNRYLRDSFISYLEGNQNLESALGLKRKKARPRADPKLRTDMATQILKLRLMEDMSHEDAREKVSAKFGWGITIMNDAWKAHKQDALISLRLERASDGYPWTAEEVKGLTKILGKEPWFVSAEKLATKPD